jgi:hypothetical protein
VVRLRDHGLRYRGLAFTVSSAVVVSHDADVVVLRATVDRAACTVVGADGSTQPMAQASGPPLRYTVRRAAGGWALTDVGPA